MITHHCIIRDQNIVLDGKVIFSEKNSDLDAFLLNAYTSLKVDYPKFYKMDNLSKLGFLAAEMLLKDRGLLNDYAPEQVALVLSNAHSSTDTDRRYTLSSKTAPSPALFVYTLPNIVAGEICIRHKIKGENAFFVAPAFDPELMADYVDIVMAGDTGASIGGWVDVLGGHYDVFLYLHEKNKAGLAEHTAGQLKELYNTTLWNS